MAGSESMATLLAAIDAEQARVREMLAGRDESALETRPPSGKWSVFENLRHLLFAEEAHLGQFVPGGLELSAIGLATTPLAPKLPQVGTRTPSGVGEVLQAWQAVHVRTKAALAERDTPDVRYRVERHLRHQRRHITEIERLLRASDRAARQRSPSR